MCALKPLSAYTLFKESENNSHISDEMLSLLDNKGSKIVQS